MLADAPAFDTVEELLELAADREGWREVVHALLPASDPSSLGAAGKRRGNKMVAAWKELARRLVLAADYHSERRRIHREGFN